MSEELKNLKKQLLKDERNGYDVLSASELEKIGCKLKYTGEFFHEFVTETACPNCRKKILDALAEKNILGGAEVDGGILWCVTELVSKEKLDEVVAIVKEVLGK